MPMYSFKCPVCGRKETVTRTMAESDESLLCTHTMMCTDMNRDFQADLPHAASDRYDNPIVSSSMAMAIDQIPEHKKMFPNIPVTPEGEPVFENYADHESYIDKCGFVKHPGKRVNNSGKRVTKLSEVKARLEASNK